MSFAKSLSEKEFTLPKVILPKKDRNSSPKKKPFSSDPVTRLGKYNGSSESAAAMNITPPNVPRNFLQTKAPLSTSTKLNDIAKTTSQISTPNQYHSRGIKTKNKLKSKKAKVTNKVQGGSPTSVEQSSPKSNILDFKRAKLPLVESTQILTTTKDTNSGQFDTRKLDNSSSELNHQEKKHKNAHFTAYPEISQENDHGTIKKNSTIPIIKIKNGQVDRNETENDPRIKKDSPQNLILGADDPFELNSLDYEHGLLESTDPFFKDIEPKNDSNFKKAIVKDSNLGKLNKLKCDHDSPKRVNQFINNADINKDSGEFLNSYANDFINKFREDEGRFVCFRPMSREDEESFSTELKDFVLKCQAQMCTGLQDLWLKYRPKVCATIRAHHEQLNIQESINQVKTEMYRQKDDIQESTSCVSPQTPIQNYKNEYTSQESVDQDLSYSDITDDLTILSLPPRLKLSFEISPFKDSIDESTQILMDSLDDLEGKKRDSFMNFKLAENDEAIFNVTPSNRYKRNLLSSEKLASHTHSETGNIFSQKASVSYFNDGKDKVLVRPQTTLGSHIKDPLKNYNKINEASNEFLLGYDDNSSPLRHFNRSPVTSLKSLSDSEAQLVIKTKLVSKTNSTLGENVLEMEALNEDIPKYSEMSLQELKTAVQKFGIRPSSRGIMIRQLQNLWDAVNGQQEKDSIGKFKVEVTKDLQDEQSFFSPLAETVEELSNMDSEGADEIDSDFENTWDDFCSSEPSDAPGSKPIITYTSNKIKDYIESNPQYHMKVLEYQPINLEKFYLDIQNSGIECTKTQLRAFCDSQAIITYIPNKTKKKFVSHRSLKNPRKK
ncbi:hypothetical protein G9A89_008287 [Geosiphon pyriformis]|nr:hypothetical protein G9A89_008287 [Geosiphon pyriformis]